MLLSFVVLLVAWRVYQKNILLKQLVFPYSIHQVPTQKTNLCQIIQKRECNSRKCFQCFYNSWRSNQGRKVSRNHSELLPPIGLEGQREGMTLLGPQCWLQLPTHVHWDVAAESHGCSYKIWFQRNQTNYSTKYVRFCTQTVQPVAAEIVACLPGNMKGGTD